MFQKKNKSVDIEQFWKDYEESIGEKVLAKSLGQYLNGFPGQPYPLWGLAIATSGGFRFHHFPHEGWLMAISRVSTGGEAPKEKTFFIPKDSINSIELIQEKRWWKKILSPANPALAIHCRVNGEEARIFIETDLTASAIAQELCGTTDRLQADNSGAG